MAVRLSYNGCNGVMPIFLFLINCRLFCLQAAMDEQAVGERQHGGDNLLSHYWSKVMAALRNPVTLTASAWGFFYLW